MGNQKSTLSRERQEKRVQKFQVVNDYRNCYDQWKNSPNFMTNLLCENKKFTHNLLQLFPNAHSSYEDFLQMIYYMRKYDAHLQRHQIAKSNIPHTTLLDRFFMVCLGLKSHSELSTTILNQSKREELLMQYMKLFIANPEGGFMKKLQDFVSISSPNMNVKQFSSLVRQYFPHAQKHLKDYYMLKFRDMEKDGLLLKHFNSNILKEDGVLMSMKQDSLTKKQIKMLYSSESYGLSFHSIEKQIVGYTGPWLLLVEHFENDDKKIYKFGSYQSGPICDTNTFQGNLEGFLFSIQPKIRFMTTDKGENGHFYFYLNTIDEKTSKMRKGIGFGGNKYKQEFKLWIDEDLDKSKVNNGNDATYGFGCLASMGTSTLSVRKLEIWGLGSLHDLKNQQQYWKQRNQEIMKRRKVNKKQLVDGNASLVFEKTFAHRDQVYGQIERNQKEEQK